MKNKYLLFILFSLFSIVASFSQTVYTSVKSGNWNDPTTWNTGTVPQSNTTDDVIIGNHTVTITASATCKNLTTNPGDTGQAIIVINNGFKLTVSGIFNVQASNTDNATFVTGTGDLQVLTLNIGQSNFSPTVTKLTTLFVDNITLFKITGNMSILTRVNTVSPGAVNQCRLRHRSGVIELNGTLTASNTNVAGGGTVSTNILNLGYRTDNVSQGLSKIIFTNTNPMITASTDSASNFTGGAVEFRMPIGTYTLPALAYKELILNSPGRTFISTNLNTSIVEGGKLYLTNGTLNSTAIGFNDDTEIIRSDGVLNRSPRLITISNRIRITYAERSTEILSGNELTPVFNVTSMPLSIKSITVNTTNGASIVGVVTTDNFIINAVNTTNGVNIDNVTTDNLTISANCNLTGVALRVEGVFSVSNSAIVTVQENLLTLASGVTSTARVAPLLKNEAINGKIIVERYLSNNKRQWRLLTAPVKGDSNNSVYYNWQNNGVAEFNGVELYGPDGTLSSDGLVAGDDSTAGNGLVFVDNSLYNLRKWDNDTGSFRNVTNTVTEPLFDGTKNFGFLSFFTHPFLSGTDGAGGYSNDTTPLLLTSAGSLITGSVTYPNITNTKYYIIGNPYASPLNFQNMLADADNSGINKLWLLDPVPNSPTSLGNYVIYDAVSNIYSNAGSSFSGGREIQSGQAFFVLAAGTGSLKTTSLTIKESHKSTRTVNTTLNRIKTGVNTGSSPLFRILLEKASGSTYANADGCVAVFYEGGSNLVEGNDGYKLSNPGENISLLNTSTSLSIEHRAPIQDADFLTLRIGQAVVGTNYKLKLYTEDFVFTGTAHLQDLFLGTTTAIALDGSVFEYVYQVTSNAASTGNRFKIIFKQNSTLSVDSFNALAFSVYPNPASNNDLISIQFQSQQNDGGYKYEVINVLGQTMLSGDLYSSHGIATITTNSKLSCGMYVIRVSNKENNVQYTNKLIIK